jgi:hypothetical protein
VVTESDINLPSRQIKKDDMKKLIEGKIDELDRKRTWVGHWYFKNLRRKRVIPEIYYDWGTVFGFADKVKIDLNIKPTDGKDNNQKYLKDLNRYATIMAYLELAKVEKNPGEAWNQVNSADKLLPLIVHEDDFERCLLRLRAWDFSLFERDESAKEKLRILDEKYEVGSKLKIWDDNIPYELKEILEQMLNETVLLIDSQDQLKDYFEGIPTDLITLIDDNIFEINMTFYKKKQSEIWKKSIGLKLQTKIKDLYNDFIGLLKDKNRYKIKDQKDIKKLERSMQKRVFRTLEKTRDQTLERIEKTYQSHKNPPSTNSSRTEDSNKNQNDYFEKCRRIEYCKQANRAQLWYSLNMEQSLKFDLWQHYNKTLLIALIPAVIIAEFLFTMFNSNSPLWYRPFIFISVMGFLGGGLSARLIARDLVEENSSAQLIKVIIHTRMFIGAAGAFVILIFVAAGFLSGQLIGFIDENFHILILIGITAGFSEQLFVDALDKSSKNLDMINTPMS